MFSNEYLAGIVDGEGTISIARQKNLTNGKPEYYVGQVYITNSNTRLLEALKEQFGGHITKARRNKGKN
jgi:LAGLIDADG endonuclease